jgi:hypothetical protein
MKVLATLILLLNLPSPHFSAPPKAPIGPAAMVSQRVHGRWFLAENGHAVYCYGPVMVVNDPLTGLQRVATFCKGEKAVVPLKD